MFSSCVTTLADQLPAMKNLTASTTYSSLNTPCLSPLTCLNTPFLSLLSMLSANAITQSSFSGGFSTVLRRSGLRGSLAGDRCKALRFFDSGETDDWGVAGAGWGSFGMGKGGFMGEGMCSLCGEGLGIVRSGDPSSCGTTFRDVSAFVNTSGASSGAGEDGTLDRGDESPKLKMYFVGSV